MGVVYIDDHQFHIEFETHLPFFYLHCTFLNIFCSLDRFSGVLMCLNIFASSAYRKKYYQRLH